MAGLHTSAVVWKAVMEMFSPQSQARVVQLRTRHNQCQKRIVLESGENSAPGGVSGKKISS
jgi:hypothetical protein